MTAAVFAVAEAEPLRGRTDRFDDLMYRKIMQEER